MLLAIISALQLPFPFLSLHFMMLSGGRFLVLGAKDSLYYNCSAELVEFLLACRLWMSLTEFKDSTC